MGKIEAIFQPEFLDDLSFWYQSDPMVAKRILSLMSIIVNSPDGGEGRPVEMYPNGIGLYSRRITQEHRLVYWIEPGNGDGIEPGKRCHFLQGRFHYQRTSRKVEAFTQG